MCLFDYSMRVCNVREVKRKMWLLLKFKLCGVLFLVRKWHKLVKTVSTLYHTHIAYKIIVVVLL